MSTEISQDQIGQRIAILRKRKGLSQEELAKKIGLSRPSLAQVEGGGRKLSVSELVKMSMALGFSLDVFVSEEFIKEKTYAIAEPEESVLEEERVSIPSLQLPKFKQILLYILERCAGKPNVGETVLYKLLYFADFNYYELHEEHLTGATYRKLPYGPVPLRLDSVINEMIDEGELKRIKTDFHGYLQTRYLPLEKPDLKLLKASEKEVIDRVIEQFSDWSASAISAYSHKDMPWLASRDGEVINYELAFYRELPFSVRNYNDEIEQP